MDTTTLLEVTGSIELSLRACLLEVLFAMELVTQGLQNLQKEWETGTRTWNLVLPHWLALNYFSLMIELR